MYEVLVSPKYYSFVLVVLWSMGRQKKKIILTAELLKFYIGFNIARGTEYVYLKLKALVLREIFLNICVLSSYFFILPIQALGFQFQRRFNTISVALPVRIVV